MEHNDHVNLLRPAQLPAGGTWADLGAGAGAFTLALRELVGPQASIHAVDRDAARLRELEQNWRTLFGGTQGLQLIPADFTRDLTTAAGPLPPLDGILMANSLHFFKDKLGVPARVRALLKPGGALLLVEYDVDAGNPWVPYPLSFHTWSHLAPRAGFDKPRLLATRASSFLRGFYAALGYKLPS